MDSGKSEGPLRVLLVCLKKCLTHSILNSEYRAFHATFSWPADCLGMGLDRRESMLNCNIARR